MYLSQIKSPKRNLNYKYIKENESSRFNIMLLIKN